MREAERTYIGIDPGTSGGIAIFAPGRRFSVFPMPYSDGAYNEQRICAYLEEHVHPVAIIEHVHAVYGSSAGSTFNFGMGFGLIRGILAALEIPYQLVTPKKWQDVMLHGENRKDTKAASVRVALRLFPQANFFVSERSKKHHHGMTDAALIAEYGRRMHL